jgi:hypothetical protein
MPTLYLHVGVHKTGTTALQYVLAKRRAWLGDQGISYPAAGIPQSAQLWGHHDLAWALREGDTGGLSRAVRAGIRTDRAVISSEEFCLLRNGALFQPLVAAFAGWTIRPVCYIRRQDQVLESIYNHHVKSLGEADDILAFARKIRRRLDYGLVLGRLEQVFGRNAMIVRLYDKAVIGDTVSDFFSLLGIDSDPVAGLPDINAGLTLTGLREMLQANRTFAADPDRLVAARTGIIAAHSSRKFAAHGILTDAERHSLMEEFRPSNRAVLDRYFDGKDLLNDDLILTGT